jgi:hypothetical protein
MIIKSKSELAIYLGVSMGRLDGFFNRLNIKRPDNVGTHRKPEYNVTDEYLKYFDSINDVKKKNKVKDDTIYKPSVGDAIVRHMEKKQAEVDREYKLKYGF